MLFVSSYFLLPTKSGPQFDDGHRPRRQAGAVQVVGRKATRHQPHLRQEVLVLFVRSMRVVLEQDVQRACRLVVRMPQRAEFPNRDHRGG
eukprot:COSAG02_NODE_1460_length_12494_cov_126.207422_12_plen_90_part_00